MVTKEEKDKIISEYIRRISKKGGDTTLRRHGKDQLKEWVRWAEGQRRQMSLKELRKSIDELGKSIDRLERSESIDALEKKVEDLDTAIKSKGQILRITDYRYEVCNNIISISSHIGISFVRQQSLQGKSNGGYI